MLYQIISFVLEVVTGLLTGACLLRLYMQFQRIPLSAKAGNPIGRFVFALTDWLVLPLRRLLPAMGRIDTGSLVGAFLVQLVYFSSLWLLNGGEVAVVTVIVLAAFGVMRMAITGMVAIVIVFAILSWVQTQSYLSDLLERLVAPALAPIRRVLPLIGGIDLSPLVLLVLLQIGQMVLGQLQGMVLGLLF